MGKNREENEALCSTGTKKENKQKDAKVEEKAVPALPWGPFLSYLRMRGICEREIVLDVYVGEPERSEDAVICGRER